MRQHRDRQDETQHHGHRTDQRRHEAGSAPERHRRHRCMPASGAVMARGAAARAFERRDHQRESEEPERELRRRRPVRHREPGGVDPGGEGLDAEIGHRAEIRDRLHDREQDPRGDRRARHRQADPEERAGGAAAQRASGDEGGAGLLQERRPGQQVDIGVEHQRQHQRGAGQRPDLGEPVVAGAPARHLAQERLDRAGMVEKIGIGIGQDIGGKGQRQRQRDLEHPHAGKPRHGDEPGGAGADHRGARRDHQHQRHRGRGIARQHGAPERGQRVGPADECGQRHREHRQQAQGGRGDRTGSKGGVQMAPAGGGGQGGLSHGLRKAPR